MAHNVETMAYTNEVPWHGLGVKVGNLSVEAMLKAASLDWRVERRPLFYANDQFAEAVAASKAGIKATITNDRRCAEFAALVRDTDGQVFDIVGSRYQPRQNKDVFKFFDEFVRAGSAKMETAGSLQLGRIVWGLANLQDSFKLAGGDTVKGYLLAASFHKQGKANLYKFTAVRVVCNNTFSAALGAGGEEFKDYHSVAFDDAQIERAKTKLGIARERFHDFERQARIIQSVKLMEKDAMRVLANVYQPEDTAEVVKDFDKANAVLKKVWGAYLKAPGAQPGNGWGVFNAVTYYADHQASRTADKRLSNAWMGKTANQKQDVLDKLLQLV